MSEKREVYVIGAMRSPIASVSFGGFGPDKVSELPNVSSISSLVPDALATQVLNALFKQISIDPELIDMFVMGSVISQKVEPQMKQAPAKHLIRKILKDRDPKKYPLARTIEKACSTGLMAVWYGAKKILLGKADIVIAGGVDMMSRQPNSVILNGLTDPDTQKLMVVLADEKARALGFNRESHDEYAFQSYERAKSHRDDYAGFITQIFLSGHEEPVLKYDEEIDKYKITIERIKRLRPYPNCKIMTILNSSKYGDAAAFVILASSQALKNLKIKPLARLLAFNAHSESGPEDFIVAPAEAVSGALSQANLQPDNIDVYE